ncbi:MAG TPA: type II secretion system F family protein, partial [Armatimonadota bacterium]|nr:type II secretion system F family protein [Armatimonadota bacterium]
SMGYRPTSVQVAQRNLTAGAFAAPAHVTASSYTAGGPAGPVSNLSANERARARMFHQLYISFRAGMPAYQAVTTVASQVFEPALRQALVELGVGIQQGHALSLLMERYPRLFSRGDVGIIRAAELGGFLPEALESIARRYEEDDNTRRRLRIWVWFFHSNVITLALAIAFAFFFFAFISTMNPLAGAAAVGRAFLLISLPMLLLYFGGLLYLQRIRTNPAKAYAWHRFLLRVPMAGKINRLRATSVFTRTLEYLSNSGVAGPTAWSTAAGAVPNLYLAEQFAGAAPAVAATARFTPAMQSSGLFDPADVGMVATGEATGEIPQALKYLADRYEEET